MLKCRKAYVVADLWWFDFQVCFVVESIMRFKRGSMVEVLSKKEPSGAWRCAEIVADNGDGYTVRYYRRPGIAKDGVDNVQAEAVRSCPRPATGSRNFVVGDIVEVLDDGYWRVARIDEVMEDDYCYIRVIGSLDEFRVKNSSIRARQEWKNNKWVLMDKVLYPAVYILVTFLFLLGGKYCM